MPAKADHRPPIIRVRKLWLEASELAALGHRHHDQRRRDKPHFGLSAKLVCDTSLSSELYGELFLPICIESARIRHHDDTGSIGTKNLVYKITPEAQALFCRRRHQPRRPPPSNIRPGSPAPPRTINVSAELTCDMMRCDARATGLLRLSLAGACPITMSCGETLAMFSVRSVRRLLLYLWLSGLASMWCNRGLSQRLRTTSARRTAATCTSDQSPPRNSRPLSKQVFGLTLPQESV
jgi:hypothetical protein